MSTGCNTNQGQDLNNMKDISCNTHDHERNISTMTVRKQNVSKMKDSTSSTSNELGIMTNQIKSNPKIMKDIANEAKNEYDIGVMAQKSKKKTSNSECNTQLNESDIGINCKMQELISKRDTECDACQFEQTKGVNTPSTRAKVHLSKDTSTFCPAKTEHAINTHTIEGKACATMTNHAAFLTDSTINTEVIEESIAVMTNITYNHNKVDNKIKYEIYTNTVGEIENETNEVSTTTKPYTND